MRFFKWLTGSVSGLMLVSCVTINIYFPAAAAEKAADRIIEDIWGPEASPELKPADKPADQSSQINSQQPSLALTMLDWLIPQAIAAEANLNINSPAISSLQAQMKNRHLSLKPYYDSGAIGLTENGLLTMHNANAVSLKDRNTVKALIADENTDRQSLYAEIARANGHPEWKADIQSTFARRWISNAGSGWWYQLSGSWKQK